MDEQYRSMNRLIESVIEIRNCRKDIVIAALSLSVVRQNHKFPCSVVKSLKESIKGNVKAGDQLYA